MKKKVLYLMEFPLDLPGGAQLSTIGICCAIKETDDCGWEPVAACPALMKPESKENYPFRVEEYPAGYGRAADFLIRMLSFVRIIRRVKPDLIHIQMSESLITYGFIRGLFPAVRFVYTDRGMYFGYKKRSMFFIERTLKHSAALITTTRKNKGLWRENTRISPVAVISNTIGKEFATYDPALKKQGGKFTIGFAGRISEEKDWPFVPVLVGLLREAGLDFRVHLVLSMYEKTDPDFAKELCDKITAITGEENFIFESELDQAQMSRYYYGLDLFCMTSSFESFGKAAVEAMSRHCALISTAVGGLPEVVGREECLYSKEEPERAVRHVKELMEDEEFLRSEQDYFLDRYRRNFTQEEYLRRHLMVYDEISSASAPEAPVSPGMRHGRK